MAALQDVVHVADHYEVGAILEHSWGYDQTNIDYFAVLKRSETPKGDVWLTLVPMTNAGTVETGFMSGETTPGTVDGSAKAFRRKLHVWNGEERGVSIHKSYGWCSLWDGKPSRCSWYA